MRIFVWQMWLKQRKVYIDLDHVLMIDVTRNVKTPPVPHPVEKIMMDLHSWEICLTMAFRNEPVVLLGSVSVPVGADPGEQQVDRLLAEWEGCK